MEHASSKSRHTGGLTTLYAMKPRLDLLTSFDMRLSGTQWSSYGESAVTIGLKFGARKLNIFPKLTDVNNKTRANNHAPTSRSVDILNCQMAQMSKQLGEIKKKHCGFHCSALSA